MTVVGLIIASLRLASPTATAVCGRDVRMADASAICGRRSAIILEIHGLTCTARPRKFADADRRESLTQARHSAS